jgi:hypothetical protein
MPENETRRRAAKDKREGKHGARSAKQAIAIGLSKARRAGVEVPPPKPGRTSKAVLKKAERDTVAGAARKSVSKARSQATSKALKREGTAAARKAAHTRELHVH